MPRKVRLLSSQTYRVVETRGTAQLVGKRIRVILPETVMEVPMLEGFLHGLQGFVLSGPAAGSTVDLPPCRLRAVAKRHCNCSALPFPHAPGFAPCTNSKEEVEPEVNLDNLFTTKKGDSR